ncbi:hypothetical protein J5N97_026122 [Dioscorea zingiberensis]|uniref:Uncharacterized protein n=1 Tax=Dioscorea zingiberensis TaxID=325984 RepID=A0A9D5H680_9LILI|nr:hypothetical protein J5N97_026122 [Dioscorea zingiberensis]
MSVSPTRVVSTASGSMSISRWAGVLELRLARLGSLDSLSRVVVDSKKFLGLKSVPDVVEYLHSGESLGKVLDKLTEKDNRLPSKRLADRSKRVQAPNFILQVHELLKLFNEVEVALEHLLFRISSNWLLESEGRQTHFIFVYR